MLIKKIKSKKHQNSRGISNCLLTRTNPLARKGEGKFQLLISVNTFYAFAEMYGAILGFHSNGG
ncbi:unnamed protein product [Musa acuminata subsp. malaccensis]|uniref:(wild Malaysian banana) hypothetical protein n=1 Tax=Musa acuminata subsp. malaccensis TaxID=214687 RepID=A0A804JQ45_MUSAM|nr:unnamed protein product [Musa acuminata subsp. malaccensis]